MDICCIPNGIGHRHRSKTFHPGPQDGAPMPRRHRWLSPWSNVDVSPIVKNVRYNLDVIHWGYSWIYWGYSWIYSCIVKNCWIYWGLKKQRYSPIQHNCWMYITNDRFGWIAMNYQPEKPHAERHPGEKIVAWIRHDGRIAMMPCTFSMLPSPKTLHHRCGLLLDEN